MLTGVVDYEAGNLRSVETALSHLGVRYRVSADPEELLRSDRLIFPGVGEASAAMGVLRQGKLDEAIRDFFRSGKPMLGICLGAQITLSRSEERDVECIGLVAGSARLFPGGPGLKVPHMGWNAVRHDGRHPVFRGIPDGAAFYFVHSYYPSPDDPADTIAESDHGIRFTAAFARDNFTAVQFHPEKSGPVGLRLLENFLKG